MRVISLDESGSFEKELPESNARNSFDGRIIAGVDFSVANKEERATEAARIRRMLEWACDSVGANFPEDLHITGESNSNRVKLVKQKIYANMADFFQGKGEFANNKPHGTYRLYAIVHMENNLRDLSSSNLIKINVAANLYEGMAYHVIENLLFYDANYFERANALYLATRTPPLSLDNANVSGAALEGFKNMGLVPPSQNCGKNYMDVTTASSYRAALAQMVMHNSWNTDLQMDPLDVRSFSYKNENGKRKFMEEENQPFLCLADLVCSKFRDALIKEGSIGNADALVKLKHCGVELIGSPQNSFWAYDDVDVCYRHAFAACQSGDVFGSLEYIYKAEVSGLNTKKYYEANWYPIVRSQLEKTVTPQTLKYALERLRAALQAAEFSLPQCEFVLGELKNLAEKCRGAATDIGVQYQLYTNEIAIENHNGRYDNAQAAFEHAELHASEMSAEEYLELRNLHAVSLTDGGQAAKAAEFTKQTVDYEELLISLRKEMLPSSTPNMVHLGRSESQLGQCYAFCGQYEKAAVCFERAIECFEASTNQNINKQITLSYYLHSLIEQPGARDTYEKYAMQYFGARGYEEQFEKLKTLDDTSRRFAIYVYIKALFIYYRKSASTEFLSRLLSWLDSEACSCASERDQHPWEIIYKYCAAFALVLGDKKAAARYRKKASKFLEDDEVLLHKIVANGEKELAQFEASNKKQLFLDDKSFLFMYH